MAQWSVVLPDEQWATERLFQHDVVTVADGPAGPSAGDEVLVVAEESVVALARVEKADGGDLVLGYRRRAFDEPLPVEGLTGGPVDEVTYRRLAARLGGTADWKPWLVSVAMPIEANSPAEAVRQFWSHVLELGPAELPTYVWPSGDELAMQAFVLGAEANQDPEEEDEDD
ncbi:hypothetical protein [Actinoplanes sp. GCM10030250]|uniref:hypothetical protein n=1 Tax=Actinoplanes sp. GCM10030250 TaxID=3273376 RepID=UPI003612012A